MEGRDLHGLYRMFFTLSFYYHYDLNTLEDRPIFELEMINEMITQAQQEKKDEQQGML